MAQRIRHKDYSSQFMCVCVYVYAYSSVTVLIATYLVCKAKVRYGILQICNVHVDFAENPLFKVMVLFALI